MNFKERNQRLVPLLIKRKFWKSIGLSPFTISSWYRIMVNKHGAKALYPNMTSLLELCIIIPSSSAEVERGFSLLKLLCIRLRASILPITLDILMRDILLYFNDILMWRLTYRWCLWESCRNIPRQCCRWKW